MLEIGSILERKYKILDVIGRGGMSTIYLARNERAAKTWAIKEVRKEGVINEQENLAGLIAETNLLKELHHKNIVSIIDVIDYEDSFIIVMDYIEGKDLKKVIEEEGAQSSERVRQWGMTICDVFGYLHAQNPPIIYRDLKPNNLMRTSDGDIVLIDFGTARKFKNQGQVDDTKPLGTVGYAAPEQYGGHGETDARTDIYTIGATLFHLLTGFSPADPPFYGVTLLRNVDPAFEGTGWEYIINKCCQQKREDRYQSCEELRYDIEHCDELGRAETKSRKRKWGIFLTSVVFSLVGALGMLVFSVLKNNAVASSYEGIIDKVKYGRSDDGNELSLEDKFKLLKDALNVDASKEEAYIKLIEIILEDTKLDEEEIDIITSCLIEKNDNGEKYIDVLKSRNRPAYDRLYYRIGIMYFLMHKNSIGDMEEAVIYLKEVEASENLSEDEQKLAGCMVRIGEGNGKLEGKGKVQFFKFDDEYTYKNFWDDLGILLEQSTKFTEELPSLPVAASRMAMSQLSSKCDKFKTAKDKNENIIHKADMDARLELVKEILDAAERKIHEEESDDKGQEVLLQEARTAYDNAEHAVNAAFGVKEG